MRSFVMELPTFAPQFVEILAPTGKCVGKATAFFVRDRSHQTYLVTNRHVVTGERWDDDNPSATVHSALRITAPKSGGRAGLSLQFVIHLGDEKGAPVWLEHPQHRRRVDVVAIPLNWGELLRDVDVVTYPLESEVARLDVTGTLYVTGFPTGFDPLEEYVFAVWTRASIAWPPRLDWRDLPCFLVDCRSRKGQSGSPVIFYADRTASFVGADGQIRTGPAWNLVGVYSGRIDEESDIGIVWKRAAMETILASGYRPDEPEVMPLEHPSQDDVVLATTTLSGKGGAIAK